MKSPNPGIAAFSAVGLLFATLPLDAIPLGADSREVPRHYVPGPVSLFIDNITLAQPAFSNQWSAGLSGTIAFSKAGDYHAAFVRPYHDSVRGDVAEINFPPTASSGQRSVEIILRKDARARGICFQARRLRGDSRLTAAIYSDVNYSIWEEQLVLTDAWKTYRMAFGQMQRPGHPDDRLQAGLMGTLRFAGGSEERVFLVQEPVLEAVREPQSLYITRPRSARWCFSADETVRLTCLASSSIGRDCRMRSVVRRHGQAAGDTVELNAHVGSGVSAITLGLGKRTPGYYDAAISLSCRDSSGGIVARDSMTDHFAVCPKDPSADSSPIGLNVSAYVYGPGHFKSLATAGIRRIQVSDFKWHDLEPVRGELSFIQFDSLVAWAAQAGLSIMPTTGYSPSWAVAPPLIAGAPLREPAAALENMPPADIAQWSNRYGQLAKRYRNSIHAWEFWSEPDLNGVSGSGFMGSAAEYFALLSALHNAFNESAPGTMLVSGGISKSPGVAQADFAARLADKENIRSFDIFGFHAYHDSAVSRQSYETVRKTRPDIPVWMTEVGVHNLGDSEADARSFSVLLARYAFHFLQQRVGWWCVMYYHPDMLARSFKSSLLYADGSPMRKLATLCTTARMLGDLLDVHRVDGMGMPGYAFTTKTRHGLCILGPGTATVSSAANTLKRTDWLGAESELSLTNGSATIVLAGNEVAWFTSSSPMQAGTH